MFGILVVAVMLSVINNSLCNNNDKRLISNDPIVLRKEGICDDFCISKCCRNGNHYVGGFCVPIDFDLIWHSKLAVNLINEIVDVVNISEHFNIVFGITCKRRYRQHSIFYLQTVSFCFE